MQATDAPPGIGRRQPALQSRRYRRGLPALLYTMIEARARQSGISHITGDIHYLALALDRKSAAIDCGLRAGSAVTLVPPGVDA